jgi:trehalose 6-phosphate phosphatase
MRQMTAMLPLLRRRLRGVPGVDIENKRLSISIHYRKARAKRQTVEIIRAALAELLVPARVIFGKQLVNVLPPGAPGKGYALQKLRKKLRVERAMYVGDDLTDEDVFSSKQAGLLGVRVGRPKSSAANYFLRDQREIDRFLRRLLLLRQGHFEVE